MLSATEGAPQRAGRATIARVTRSTRHPFALLVVCAALAPPVCGAPAVPLEETGIATLQAEMATGHLTSRRLVEYFLARIEAFDRNGPHLNAMTEINPEALAIADRLDAERREKGPRGPLHGIPVLIKDNIDTADAMLTTAGSLALVGSHRAARRLHRRAAARRPAR